MFDVAHDFVYLLDIKKADYICIGDTEHVFWFEIHTTQLKSFVLVPTVKVKD
jgi:hypothetical protein